MNTVASLPAKWRKEAAENEWNAAEADSIGLNDAAKASDRRAKALTDCANELEAALASPAQSAGVGVEELRVEFERWVSKRHGCGTERWADSGKYCYDNTNAWWECWCAALQHPAAPSVSPAVEGGLPELPPTWRMHQHGSGFEDVYTADQMRTYGEQCRLTTPEQPAIDIDACVDRFLGWRLPDDFAPDDGISFTPITNPAWLHDNWPIGTNLLTAVQARAMLEYVLNWTAGAPSAQQPLDGPANNAGVATGSRNGPPSESVTRGNPSSNLEQPGSAVQGEIYVEARECSNCEHIGINDSHETDAACHDCEWSGPSPVEDKCPGCGNTGCMTAACPDCGSRYRLAASLDITTPPPAPAAEQGEMSPEFTDSARAALAWALYHHQGGNSTVGQAIRFALGMGEHEPLPAWRITEAKAWAERVGAKTADLHANQPEARGVETLRALNAAEMLETLLPYAEAADDAKAIRNLATPNPVRAEQPSKSPSYDSLLIIAQSVCGALGRAGLTDCDDPGEAIDVMRERYEKRLTERANWMAVANALKVEAETWVGRNPEFADGYETAIRRAEQIVRQFTVEQPEGKWMLVPLEPTDAMLESALTLQGEDAALARSPALLSALLKIYRAMLASAPAAPVGVDAQPDCRCVDCGGNQPKHDPTCSYMRELHGEQPGREA